MDVSVTATVPLLVRVSVCAEAAEMPTAAVST